MSWEKDETVVTKCNDGDVTKPYKQSTVLEKKRKIWRDSASYQLLRDA